MQKGGRAVPPFAFAVRAWWGWCPVAELTRGSAYLQQARRTTWPPPSDRSARPAAAAAAAASASTLSASALLPCHPSILPSRPKAPSHRPSPWWPPPPIHVYRPSSARPVSGLPAAPVSPAARRDGEHHWQR
ncbi:uncharacterized protein SETTUDRAFT_39048 [Exserohilum turcica Et28A]|uniref:Uncharacterized protein n=1 Tax=Exserohilum turcicum (strain 28A) TaxID=671987 RepID=R0ITE0_EXST2|nr:uncharacterized protein SETTUDRAFT_39048 [Exserohilum turcica Et28A]EOA87921.1 hypothetical protein SETTUDRAFT_39048 [Exserohilum turcica Et28A]